MSADGHHVLHVRTDPGFADGLRYAVTCPHDPTDMGRDCVTWWPCADHDDLDGLDEHGEGPCEEAEQALGGRHSYVRDGLFHPVRDCWLDISDSLADQARALRVGPGDYPVEWNPENTTALGLRLAAVAAP